MAQRFQERYLRHTFYNVLQRLQDLQDLQDFQDFQDTDLQKY